MDFELCLFHFNLPFTLEALAGGVDSILIDWECKGKEKRQKNFDTQINAHTVADLEFVRKATQAPILCRINGPFEQTPLEIEQAIHFGADEILLPMVKAADEVEKVLHQIDGRLPLGILVETLEALSCAKRLGQLPISRVYIGLNDLAIARNSHNLFLPLAEGTIDQIRGCFSCPFGFAGLTLPHRGFPIPCSLLIAELLRLNAHFSFLRRSFYTDVAAKPHAIWLNQIKQAVKEASLRKEWEIEEDRKKFVQHVMELEVQDVALI